MHLKCKLDHVTYLLKTHRVPKFRRAKGEILNFDLQGTGQAAVSALSFGRPPISVPSAHPAPGALAPCRRSEILDWLPSQGLCSSSCPRHQNGFVCSCTSFKLLLMYLFSEIILDCLFKITLHLPPFHCSPSTLPLFFFSIVYT